MPLNPISLIVKQCSRVRVTHYNVSILHLLSSCLGPYSRLDQPKLIMRGAHYAA